MIKMACCSSMSEGSSVTRERFPFLELFPQVVDGSWASVLASNRN